MAPASWTYEVPAAGEGASGLEEYLVLTNAGDQVGKVVTVVEKDGETYLVVDRGTPPFHHDLRAIPWGRVESVEHDTLSVHLAFGETEFERALELDPADRVEGGPAEAVRTEPPDGLPVLVDASGPRPTDQSRDYAVMFLLAAVGLLSFMGIVLSISSLDGTWRYALLLVPAVLLLLAAQRGYSLFRRPYETSPRSRRRA